MLTLPTCRWLTRVFLAALLLLVPCAVHAAPFSPTDTAGQGGGITGEADLQIKIESTAQIKVEP